LALATGKIDGFWATGMAAELAVSSGTSTIILGIRRGDGAAGCFDYTMSVLAATDRLVEQSSDIAAAMLRALVATQKALKQDVTLATTVGNKRFPLHEATLSRRHRAP
jgi:hypothetical protein